MDEMGIVPEYNDMTRLDRVRVKVGHKQIETNSLASICKRITLHPGQIVNGAVLLIRARS